MPNQKAIDFFGEDFGSKPVVQAAPKPKEEKGSVQSALEFFGMDFSTPEPPKTKKAPVATTEGSWEDINKKYAAGHGEREKARLILLETELAETHDVPNRERLKREIKRVKNG